MYIMTSHDLVRSAVRACVNDLPKVAMESSGEESREGSREEMQTEDSVVDDVCYAGNIVEWRNRFGYWKNAHFYALSNFKIDFVAAIRARGRNEADPMLGYMCDVTFLDGKCLG